jgi:hypothetical protein
VLLVLAPPLPVDAIDIPPPPWLVPVPKRLWSDPQAGRSAHVSKATRRVETEATARRAPAVVRVSR